MSNLGQYYGKGFPLGATLTMVYTGDLHSAPDGSAWIAGTTTSPFAYNSTYASVPQRMLIPHALLPGPYDAKWYVNVSTSVAYKAAGTLYCISNSSSVVSSVEGDSTHGFIYYTSVNDGVTWTRRTFPNNKNYAVAFTAGLFVGFALSSTTNAIITSTDAMTWTSLTGISQSNIADIVSNGSTQIVAYPQSGTIANVSTDSGATWSSATITAPATAAAPLNNGYCTYNAGAGLFIGSVGVSGQYQTSPTGATWTLRSTQATFQPYGVFWGTSCRFASNNTLTIAVGGGGFFATSTDGLTWSNHGWITAGLPPTLTFSAVYYDGTYFVALAADRVFYSVNGTTWAEGHSVPGNAQLFHITNDRHIRTVATSATSLVKAFIVTNPAATTPLTVSPASAGNAVSSLNIYTRIK